MSLLNEPDRQKEADYKNWKKPSSFIQILIQFTDNVQLISWHYFYSATFNLPSFNNLIITKLTFNIFYLLFHRQTSR